MNGLFLQAALVPSWPIPPLMGSSLFLVTTQGGKKKSLNQWFSTSIGPIPQRVLWKFVDILIGCHMTGVILPMNFTLFQDSKEDFTKYLLHKAVISFNRTEDHCHQPPLSPFPFWGWAKEAWLQNIVLSLGPSSLPSSCPSDSTFSLFGKMLSSPRVQKSYQWLPLTLILPKTPESQIFKAWLELLLSYPFLQQACSRVQLSR